jgi:hypothetical protein
MLILFLNYINTKVDLMQINNLLEANLTPNQWFFLILALPIDLIFFVLLLINFIDIFKKKPWDTEKLIWEKSKLYLLIQKFRRKKT